MEKNKNLSIILYTILATDYGFNKIKNEFKNYNIDIKFIKYIDSSEYSWTNEVEKIIEELYGKQNRNINNSKCILRPYNMPNDKILPDYLKDEKLLISLFRRIPELSDSI